ncbi:hypothetical protein RHOFW104T7_18330 [Rhodanobacter thiooxydans]|uniref:Uncharacterized protein n=2 Tax=Rhodanobacter thiooxydans TaxID=416169 RepID=A0A154QF19_9GAMM|nr:hypothetical protein RHOFW104T7_18330 [Rhodanobacter thiooxydans]
MLLGACAAGGGERARPAALTAAEAAAEPCRGYVAAWVGHFRGNVARLDRGGNPGAESLRVAREQLARDGVDEASCEQPYCIIRPLGDGRLDSWCGYRRPDPTGRELYLWVPYQ